MPLIDTSTPQKARAVKTGLFGAGLCALLVAAACIALDASPSRPQASRRQRHQREQVQAVAVAPPSPSPSPPPPPPQYCVANRADNRFHTSMAAGVACTEISAKQHGVGCGHRSATTAPRDCGRVNKNDWIFSTYYQQTGECECLFGSQTSACVLVTAEEAAQLDSAPPKVCLEGFPGTPTPEA
mmetsp:Transcript_18591/g.47850  ORF Transcript_18591/g.47850 Transcript_18591/m.47850 type:complete len:184 (-) Transcript_18591:244-795(-)